jgi:hypothetical protein
MLVRTGASVATVEIQGRLVARIDWPQCQPTAHSCRRAASGPPGSTRSPMAAKERAQVLAALLHADPTRDLAQAWPTSARTSKSPRLGSDQG